MTITLTIPLIIGLVVFAGFLACSIREVKNFGWSNGISLLLFGCLVSLGAWAASGAIGSATANVRKENARRAKITTAHQRQVTLVANRKAEKREEKNRRKHEQQKQKAELVTARALKVVETLPKPWHKFKSIVLASQGFSMHMKILEDFQEQFPPNNSETSITPDQVNIIRGTKGRLTWENEPLWLEKLEETLIEYVTFNWSDE